MPSILEKDSKIQFPSITIASASAGSGKTQALAQRYVQFILSRKIPSNRLPQILAITFTNNAANEMKQRILLILKQAALRDSKTIIELQDLLSQTEEEISDSAKGCLDLILNNYGDFQVKTIDSFVTSVFRNTAIEFGVQPDIRVILNNEELIQRSFALWLRSIREGGMEAHTVAEMSGNILQLRKQGDRFLWDPVHLLMKNVREILEISVTHAAPHFVAGTPSLLKNISQEIISQAKELRSILEQSGLGINSFVDNDLMSLQKGDILSVAEKKFKNSAANRPKNTREKEAWEEYGQKIEKGHEDLQKSICRYADAYALEYYLPFVAAHQTLQPFVLEMRKKLGQMSIGEMSLQLFSEVSKEFVPRIYFKLGEVIHHFLIDEFQDTSPIQWYTLYPLIENSLAQGGSLFVVGDTKQSIYGWRGADWSIMTKLEKEPVFSSVVPSIYPMKFNYRSAEVLVEFVRSVFEENIVNSEYAPFAVQSGLDSCRQEVPEKLRGKGYVEVKTIVKDSGELEVLRNMVISTIQDCHSRGHRLSDIAILTQNNDTVVEISGWLNAQDLSVISHSSLDIRERKIVGEVIALMRFLASPVDNLSFATVLLGSMFGRILQNDLYIQTSFSADDFIYRVGRRTKEPLYSLFRAEFPELWQKYFVRLYALVGYYPLYDLSCEIYRIFRLFELHQREEATLVKLLDAIKVFETEGKNSPGEFAASAAASKDDTLWTMDVPKDFDAVQVLTIHKAKGLGFPVVLFVMYDRPVKINGQALHRGEDGISLVQWKKSMVEKSGIMQNAFQELQLRAYVDDLNSLYVALTRAREELYVFPVVKEKAKHLARLLPGEFQSPGAKPIVRRDDAHVSSIPVYYSTSQATMPFAFRTSLPSKELERGTLIHEILSKIEFIPEEPESGIRSIVAEVLAGKDPGFDEDSLCEQLRDFLTDRSIAPFFTRQSGRRVWIEKEMVSRTGILLRADRIVIDDTMATVIDFKTGGDEHEESYHHQVSEYMTLLSDILPNKTIRGFLIYIDRCIVREVT